MEQEGALSKSSKKRQARRKQSGKECSLNKRDALRAKRTQAKQTGATRAGKRVA